jgi:hypothetical protein
VFQRNVVELHCVVSHDRGDYTIPSPIAEPAPRHIRGDRAGRREPAQAMVR